MVAANFIDNGDSRFQKVYSQLINSSDNIISNGFNLPEYDYIELTYVTSGNGVGEIETVTYKIGGASGTTVATLTITYNASDEISSITKT